MMRWVFLDLDNCLYRYDLCNEEATARVEDLFKQKFDSDRDYFSEGRKVTKQLAKGTAAEHSRLLYIARGIELAGKPNPGLALSWHRAFWNAYMSQMQLYDGVENFLQANHGKYGIGTITNLTTDIQYKKIEHLGIGKYLDVVVTSEEVGVEKPDQRIFIEALRRAKCAQFDATMIGDDYACDIVPATALDMNTIHIKTGEEWKQWQSWNL